VLRVRNIKHTNKEIIININFITIKFVDRLIGSNSYGKLFLYVRPSFCSI